MRFTFRNISVSRSDFASPSQAASSISKIVTKNHKKEDLPCCSGAPDVSHPRSPPATCILRRRDLLAVSPPFGLGAAFSASLPSTRPPRRRSKPAKSPLSTTDEPPTPLKDITSYNNYYEFGTDKGDPAKNAHTLKTKPWTVKVDGLVGKPADYDLDDLIKPAQLEERIYRMRCVEGWSMVIPWVGFPLAEMLKRVEPQGSAKYVAFETLRAAGRDAGPARRFQPLPWPYVEGLRLDEAMHPLTILAVGLYGETLPNQNGAPIRLVVPWKYGFKSIKSIVRISLTEKQPPTTWNRQNAQRVRLLFQRQSGRRSSALEPGD